MSTKTSIKRIALVAAAALTLGGFSVVTASSAHADTALPFYISAADSGVQASSAAALTQAGTGVAGTYNYVELTAASDLASGAILGVSVSGVNGALSIPTQPASAADTLTVTGNTVASVNNILLTSKIRILTPTAGTFTVSVVKNVTNVTTGAVTTTALQSFSFTVAAASVVGTYSASNSFAKLVETATAVSPFNFALTETRTLSAVSTDDSAPVAKGTVGSPAQVGVVAVRLLDTQSTGAALALKTVTATIAGPGLIAGTGALTDTDNSAAWTTNSVVASSTTDGGGWAFFRVSNAGTAGVGTITVSYTDALGVTTVVSTKSITFYGDLASLKATQGQYILAAGAATGASTDTGYAVQLVGKDSAGNEVDISQLTIAGTSASTSVVASTTGTGAAASAAGTVDTLARNLTVSAVSGVAAGSTAAITWEYTKADGTKVSSNALTFTVGSTVISSLGLTFDKASYNIGDVVTATLTAKDSLGKLVADKTYSVFDTSTSTTVFGTSAQLTTAPFGSRYVTFKNGVATATFYAPFTSGDLNLSATTHATSADLAAAAQAVTVSGKVSIAGAGGDSSLAYDAASAATDAANNAYEEAQNATQAASDALAAVKALAVQVKALIALVNKIKAKLKA